MYFLNRKQQRGFKFGNFQVEVNTKDARIMCIEVDPEQTVSSEGSDEPLTDQQRLNMACKMIASAIDYWRRVKYGTKETQTGGERHHSTGDEEPHAVTNGE